jgi:hypothetical protein
MWAAASGHSTLGIPEAVGKEFVRADADQTPPAGGDLTDHEAAEAVRDNELPSPTKYGDFWLFDLRVTGTGAAFRDSLDEWAVRDPATWTTPEFVSRCAGLPVVFEHPNRAGLDEKEFRERAIGTIVLPYVRDDEVWGIAKIYDADAAALMQTTHRSTSPGVLPPKDSTVGEMKDGSVALIEGLPLVLDHLAVCENGVWDKDGPPRGIRLDDRKDGPVAKTAEEYEREIDDAKRRADAAEKERDDAMRRLDAADKEREDARRKDESDKEAIAKAEEEREKQDAARKRMDAMACERMDGESDEAWDARRKDARKDATEEERKALEEADKKREDARKDAEAAKKVDVDAERGTNAVHDSRFRDLEAEIARLKAANRPLTMEDRDAIGRAFARADHAYQMLGEVTPPVMPGESPIAYRRRLAHGLRPFTTSWQNYAFHDSQQAQDFGLVEDAIYREAHAYAKNPPAGKLDGVLREVVTTVHGKTRVEFHGDAKAPWMPFSHPMKNAIVKINRPTGNVYR